MKYLVMLTSLLVAFALPLVAKADGSDLRDNYVAGTNAGANLETDSTGSSATGNTYVGVAAGYADTTGAANVGLGYGALRAITTGRGNIGLGYMSGQDLTTDTHKLYIQNGFYPAYGVFGSFSSGFFGINNKSPVSAWDVTGAVKADSLNVTGVTSLQGSSLWQTQILCLSLPLRATPLWLSPARLTRHNPLLLEPSSWYVLMLFVGTWLVPPAHGQDTEIITRGQLWDVD